MLCAVAAFGGIENLIDDYLTPIVVDGRHLGWCRPSSSETELAESRKILLDEKAESRALPARLREYFECGNWPFSISELAKAHRSFSEEKIRDILVEKFGAKIIGDDILSLERLSAKPRLILTLRDLKRPEHLSVIRAQHNKMFGKDISEQAAGGVLGRLDEALIVERGTYGLYEHLHFSDDEVKTIRDCCYDKVSARQCFVSAKILGTQLAVDIPQFAPRLTAYIILGVCQDDPRFFYSKGINDWLG